MSRQNKQSVADRALLRVLVAAFSFALTLLLGGGCFLTASNAVAKSNNDSIISTLAEGGSEGKNAAKKVEVDVIIPSVLSLAIYPVGDHSAETDQVVLNPVSGAGLATNMLDLVVSTNVATGYQLTIEDEDNSADLANTTDNTRVIPTLTANTNTAGFPSNQWGYSVGAYDADNSEFRGVPLLGSPDIIAQSDELLPNNSETTTVSFGVKVDNGITSGIYEDVVLFTASPKLIPAKYTLTIHYRYEDGTEAAPDYTGTFATGASYDIESPEVDGYYPNIDRVTGTIDDANVEKTVTYSQDHTATVKYVYENGSEAHADAIKTGLKPGDSYSFTSPTIDGYYPDHEVISGTIANSNVVETVTYSKYYTATVKFVDENGTQASDPQETNNLKTGDSYNFTVPAITGYYADTAGPITGTIASSDFTKVVTYKPYRTMTITYKDTDGTTLKDSTTEINLKTGEPYSVDAPDIDGYTPEQATYTGTVPASDFTVAITYKLITLSDLPDGTNMQDFGSVCSATPTPSISDTVVPEATLTDSRDGKTYKVRKLADGRCWMVQDLNFVFDSNTVPLTSETSDITNDWTPDNMTQTSTGTSWDYISLTTARSYTNRTRTYYNWYAATGGTTNASTTSGDAAGSVCPKGWTLPSSDDFINLIITVYNISSSSSGSNKIRTAPIELGYTGYYIYSGGSLDRMYSDGFYWSRSVLSQQYASYVRIAGSLVNPRSSDSRGYGLAVRCVAK